LGDDRLGVFVTQKNKSDAGHGFAVVTKAQTWLLVAYRLKRMVQALHTECGNFEEVRPWDLPELG
jgi:hypothetical protein